MKQKQWQVLQKSTKRMLISLKYSPIDSKERKRNQLENLGWIWSYHFHTTRKTVPKTKNNNIVRPSRYATKSLVWFHNITPFHFPQKLVIVLGYRLHATNAIWFVADLKFCHSRCWKPTIRWLLDCQAKMNLLKQKHYRT